jgi:hypothetical protein
MPRIYLAVQLRRLVVERAQRQCEYCRLSQEDDDFPHQVDRVMARKHGGQTISDNLALACLKCNRHKGSDVAAMDPVDGALVPLFNPPVQAWGERFALAGAFWVGRTATGRATIALLRMNDTVRVDQRQRLIEAGRYPPTPPQEIKP